MDLSVIIPCHNLENFISPLLDSLMTQEFNAEIELIFVLDACEDNTRDVIESRGLESRYSVCILDADVRNCGLARNVGMEVARGTYIQFIDGDDYLIGPNCFTEILNFIKEKNVPYIKFKFDSNAFPTEQNWPMVWQFCFLREALGKLRFKKVEPNEDNIFMYRLRNTYIKGFTPPLLEKRLYYYNYGRAGSNMEKFFKELREKGRNVEDLSTLNLPGTRT